MVGLIGIGSAYWEGGDILLYHVKPEDATGKVAEAYSVFPKGVPVPTTLLKAFSE